MTDEKNYPTASEKKQAMLDALVEAARLNEEIRETESAVNALSDDEKAQAAKLDMTPEAYAAAKQPTNKGDLKDG